MKRPLRRDRALLVLVALSLGAAYAVYWAIKHPRELLLGIETDWLVLTGLAVTLTLLLVGLLLVLFRNLIKLLVERRRGILGSRFQTKLVFIFLGLLLLPSIALFYAAVSLVLQVNEALITEPRREIVEESKALLDDYNELVRSDCQRFAAQLAREIESERLLADNPRLELGSLAASFRARAGLDFLLVLETRPGGAGGVTAVVVEGGDIPPGDAELAGLMGRAGDGASQQPPADGPKLTLIDSAAEVVVTGKAVNRLQRLDGWQRASAIVPIRSGDELPAPGAVAAGRYIRPETAFRAERIDASFRQFRQSLKQQPGIRRTYIQLLGIMTLLVLFAGTWTGLYLARQITDPIQALVEGTQEISAGNLDHRVEARAADEIGYLIDSFNRMTDELRSSREAVTASRRDLEASNRQLEERRQYIEQLLENVPAGVVSLDAEGKITTMNRAAHRLLAIEQAPAPTGRPVSLVFGRDELAPLLHEIDVMVRGETVAHIQEIDMTIDGRPVHLAASISQRRDPEGRYAGILIVLEDLSALIRAQRTTAWSEVARRIAHEIKNPLTPIQLSAERILKKLRDGSDDFGRVATESADIIVKEVGTLKSLVDEFSRFARMPAVRLAPGDANAVVEAAFSLYDGIQPGIRIHRNLASGLPPIMLDADQMKRVLVNLIENATAAMAGVGTITLRTREVRDDRMVRIEVEDDGPGIPPENKERLFVPYFSTKKKGTGLGLAIANRIVSDHNGFIRFEDVRPHGSRFIIELPAER